MIKISDEFLHNKFIFIHIPKCAGTSILNTFRIPQTGHLSLYHYVKYMDSLNNYFVFTFVRNPINRFLSAFNYLSHGGRNIDDEYWKEQLSINKNNFKDIINHLNETSGKNIEIPVHFRTQTSFLKKGKLSRFNKNNFNFIGKFENIDFDFQQLCILMGKENIKLKKDNINRKTRDQLTIGDLEKKDIRLLNSFYSKDFKNFNYKKFTT